MIQKKIMVVFALTLIVTATYSYSSAAPSGEYQVMMLRHHQNNQWLMRRADLPDPNRTNPYSHQRTPSSYSATQTSEYIDACRRESKARSDAQAQCRQVKLNQLQKAHDENKEANKVIIMGLVACCVGICSIKVYGSEAFYYKEPIGCCVCFGPAIACMGCCTKIKMHKRIQRMKYDLQPMYREG